MDAYGAAGDEEEEDASLPDLEDGLLPLGVHVATLEEIERVFVTEAPHTEDRALIFRALELYAALVWNRFPDARLWVNGGFVTHKAWAPPGDVDVAVLVPGGAGYDYQQNMGDLPLWTLRGVSVVRPKVDNAERVQPMGGLVDGFYVPETDGAAVAFWLGFWQRLRRPGKPDKPGAKGFVEVRNK